MKASWNTFYATIIYLLGAGSIVLSEDMTGFVVCLIMSVAVHLTREGVLSDEIYNESEL